MPDTTPPFDLGLFHNYINFMYKGGWITTWWHYIPGGLYFVESAYEINQLYNVLIKHTGSRHIILMEVNPKNQQGWLPQEAWKWFGSHRN